MNRALLPLLVLAAALTGLGEEPPVTHPFEQEAWPGPATAIDTHVLAVLDAKGIEPANPCSDAVFARRVYLDVIGTLPRPPELRAFFEDTRQRIHDLAEHSCSGSIFLPIQLDPSYSAFRHTLLNNLGI